jgi:hypothetical protein
MFGSHKNDVSAVVLTSGEPTTEAAIDSLNRQTLVPNKVIVVRNVRPFHQAFNTGAMQVESEFFVQVDADMVLDPCCIAKLRRGMGRATGLVVGQLRDPLIGRVVGIKLIRTSCFRHVPFRDSISPDTDFVEAIATQGWKTRYVGRPTRTRSEDAWVTLGEHRPDYTSAYAYRKYLLEGRRYSYRPSLDGIRWHFAKLEASDHPSALIAQIALAQGIFVVSEKDQLGLACTDEESIRFRAIEIFLRASPSTSDNGSRPAPLPDMPLGELFGFCVRTSNALFRVGDFRSFELLMSSLSDTRHQDVAWIAKVGLCQGLTTEQIETQRIKADYQVLSEFLSSGVAQHDRVMSLRRRVRGALAQIKRRASKASG